MSPCNSTSYGKGNRKQKLQTRLSQNFDFVFTNLLKNAADMVKDLRPGQAV